MRTPILLAIATWLGTGPASAAGEPPRFGPDVLPVLRARCLRCHGTARREGGLSLRTPAAMLEGGDSGPALVRGEVGESLLIERVEDGEMPPGKSAKLSAAEVTVLRDWVAAGARDDGSSDADPAGEEPVHWAFRPPKRPEVPRLRNPARARNPIDGFLLARLEEAGLAYAPEADRRTLIRRATFDLWGLPPTPEDVEAFLADSREGRTSGWSTGSWPARATANDGRATGSTWRGTPTRKGFSTLTTSAPRPGATATG